MAGIVGLVSAADPGLCRDRLERMHRAGWEENFYSSGTYVDEQSGIYLGWRVHKNSLSDALPILNEQKDCVLVLIGEIVPLLDVRNSLKTDGHSFPPDDVSYLIHSYEERGIDFLNDLNGLFAGFLIDRRIGTGYFFNDRYGMKRIFLHEDPIGTVFSSEIRPIFASTPAVREFDPVGLSEFVTCGCTIGENSLFRNIRVIPGASLWKTVHGRVESKRTYFRRSDWEAQDRLETGRFNENVETLFPGIVRRYTAGTASIGISLTGGIDTRMVIASMDAPAHRMPCYTFGSMYRDTFDVKIARSIAEACGFSHESIILDDGFLRDFPTYLEGAVTRSGGYLGLSGAASLYVNSLARAIAPVRLTGNFGSELFRGLRAFKAERPTVRYYEPTLEPTVSEALASFQRLEQMDPISFSLFVQAPNQGFGLSSIEDSQVVMKTPFLDNDLAHLMYRGPRSYAAGLKLSISIIGKNRPELLRIPTDFGYLGAGGRLIRYLRKAHNQFLFKGEYWTSRGLPGGASALFHVIPWISPERHFLGRHKYQHYQIWLRKELAGYLRDLLLADRQLPSCVDQAVLRVMVEKHLGGKSNYLNEIDRVLTIVLCHQMLLSASYTTSHSLAPQKKVGGSRA